MLVKQHLSPKTCMFLKILIILVNLYLVSCLLPFYMFQWLLHLGSHSNMWKHENPAHLRHLFIILSLLASAVGSQATITASFSIINQCLALGCFPRVQVIHTSETRHGQVYIPEVNWLLMILSLTVTLGFQDTNKIANAAGMLSQ